MTGGRTGDDAAVDPDTVPADGGLAERAARILAAAWRAPGYTSPNRETYPWQWLWDSCFHAIVWGHLGDERAVVELRNALARQTEDGFVPHITYWDGSGTHDAFWGTKRVSSITQPPMFGHAAAELSRLGYDLGGELVDRCRAGLWHLLRDRDPHPSGLVRLCHPWESGCDDSPRWDDWCPGGFTRERWFDRKGELVRSIVRSSSGAPRGNPGFEVAPAGFNALVAFNAREVGLLASDDGLVEHADRLASLLEAQWDGGRTTWVDAGTSADGSGRIRTADGLLPALCDRRDDRVAQVLDAVLDAAAYGGTFGPAGVHRDEASFAPDVYWRGPTWPQLTYLLWVGATRRGLRAPADRLAEVGRAGAARSGFAEYWHPDTGQGFGAIPQSWTTLAAVMTPPSAP